MVERVLFRDRKHPVDRVIINDFNRKSGADLGEVKMVYGPAADEYTRSHHALALVLGTDIFFRNGAYRPETEEGRKILAHELTHVTQQKRDILRGETTREELEGEAEAAEKLFEWQGEWDKSLDTLNKKPDITSSEFDFKNKESLLTEIALNMYKNGNDNYSISKADLLKFIVNYLKQRDFDFNAEKILNEFIDIRLFDVDSDNIESPIKFRFNCFFQYFLMKNLDKQEFLNHVLKDENYLLFYNELNLYSGLKRNKIDLLDEAISRMNHYFSDLQKEVDEKHISFDSFFETDTSLSEQLCKEKKELSLESHKAEVNKDIEIIDDKFYEESKRDNKIEKKDMNLTPFQKMELSLVIAANILRNTEELPDPNKKYESFCEVLRCSLIYVTLYKQLFWNHIKNNEKEFDKEKQKESQMILAFLPMINEAFLEEQLGTAKLNPVIKKHISEIITKKDVSQLEKFSSVFLYSDFKGADYLKVIQSYLAEIKGNYIRDMTLFKLVSYYYLRSDSKQSDKDLEKLISSLVESSAKVKRKRGFIFDKNKVIAFYRDKRKEFIKDNPQE